MKNKRLKKIKHSTSATHKSSKNDFKGKRVGKLNFGKIKEVDLLGEEMEVYAGCLPTSPSTTCGCSTYYS